MSTPMPQPRLSKYRRQPEQLKSKTHALEITPRSLEIIDLIGRYKFLPTSLIKGLIEGDRSNVARHLQALFHKGYVNKFVSPESATREKAFTTLTHAAHSTCSYHPAGTKTALIGMVSPGMLKSPTTESLTAKTLTTYKER